MRLVERNSKLRKLMGQPTKGKLGGVNREAGSEMGSSVVKRDVIYVTCCHDPQRPLDWAMESVRAPRCRQDNGDVAVQPREFERDEESTKS
jgi:hypothetical protein